MFRHVLVPRFLTAIWFCLLFQTAFASVLPPDALSTQRGEDECPQEDMPPPRTIAISDNYTLQVYPSGNLYPRYMADPRRPHTGVMMIHYSRSDIPEGGKARFHLNAGGRFGIVKLMHDESVSDRGFEVSCESAILAEFNQDNNLDNIGWDGFYGFMTAWRPSETLAFKFALQHDSSHIGDEYIENTGALRIEYTREEYALGAAWRIHPSWMTYAELGRAYRFRDDQKPHRVQGGVEWTGPRTLLQHSTGWYAAMDVSVWEENDWSASTCVQAGIRTLIGGDGRQYRIGMQYYRGRSLIGEFYKYREEYGALGIWFDF